MRVHQILQKRRRRGGERAAELLDRFERAFGIPDVLKNERCAGMERQTGAVDGPDAVSEGRGEKDRRIRTERETLREPDIQGGEGVFAVHDGLGPAGRARREHDVREVGSARRQGRPSTCRCRPPRPGGLVEEEDAQPMPAGRGSFLGDVSQPHAAVALHRNQCPRARQPGNVGDRVGIGAGRQTRGYGAETQQRDERDLPLDDVRQKNDHDVATPDSALFQLFGEASGFPPQRAVAEPPTGCIGDGEAVLETLGEDGVAVAQAFAWPPPLRAIPAFSLGAVGSGNIRKRCSRALRAFGICETNIPHLPLPSPAWNNRVSSAIPTRVQRRRPSGQIQDDDIAFFIDRHF